MHKKVKLDVQGFVNAMNVTEFSKYFNTFCLARSTGGWKLGQAANFEGFLC